MGGQGPTVDFPDILADDGELKVPNRKRVKRPEPDFITTFPEAPKRKKVGCVWLLQVITLLINEEVS